MVTMAQSAVNWWGFCLDWLSVAFSFAWRIAGLVGFTGRRIAVCRFFFVLPTVFPSFNNNNNYIYKAHWSHHKKETVQGLHSMCDINCSSAITNHCLLMLWWGFCLDWLSVEFSFAWRIAGLVVGWVHRPKNCCVSFFCIAHRFPLI